MKPCSVFYVQHCSGVSLSLRVHFWQASNTDPKCKWLTNEVIDKTEPDVQSLQEPFCKNYDLFQGKNSFKLSEKTKNP